MEDSVVVHGVELTVLHKPDGAARIVIFLERAHLPHAIPLTLVVGIARCHLPEHRLFEIRVCGDCGERFQHSQSVGARARIQRRSGNGLEYLLEGRLLEHHAEHRHALQHSAETKLPRRRAVQV
eukprot:scaffold115737_cov66-Phaeocystis_antarctica.AAC.5